MSTSSKKKQKKCKDCGELVDQEAELAFEEGMIKASHPEIKKHLFCTKR